MSWPGREKTRDRTASSVSQWFLVLRAIILSTVTLSPTTTIQSTTQARASLEGT